MAKDVGRTPVRPRDRQMIGSMKPSAASIVLLPLAGVGLGLWSMVAAVPALFLAVVLLWPRGDRDFGRRTQASLLVGMSLAWVLLPHSIFDFRIHGLSPIATGTPGCQVMALAGFPLQQISAHGGGGWRLGFSLPSDRLAHLANCIVLSFAFWVAMEFVPRRMWSRVHLIACAAFLPTCLYGLVMMIRWWD